MKRTRLPNAVHEELIEHHCAELIAIKNAVAWVREDYLIEAAYCLAAEAGWGDSALELRVVFSHVAARLGWGGEGG